MYYSQKSVTELAGCAVLRLTEARGYEIRKADVAGGIELTLIFRITGIPATAGIVTIKDEGERRSITRYATGKERGSPNVFTSLVADCA